MPRWIVLPEAQRRSLNPKIDELIAFLKTLNDGYGAS